MGKNFINKEFKQYISTIGINIKKVLVKAHNSISIIKQYSCRNRTLHLYMVTATNLGLSDLEPTQRHHTARAGGPSNGSMRHRA